MEGSRTSGAAAAGARLPKATAAAVTRMAVVLAVRMNNPLFDVLRCRVNMTGVGSFRA